MNSSKQTLFWISLFAAIIIVPTLCLLWFMEQAVRNERLSTKEKIITLYRQRVERFSWDILPLFSLNREEGSTATVREKVAQWKKSPINGLIVFEKGTIRYPHNRQQSSSPIRQDSLWELEFRQKEYLKAAKLYEQQCVLASSPVDSVRMLMASARCFQKAQDTENAKKIYRTIVQQLPLTDSTPQVAYAQIALLKLYANRDLPQKDSLLRTIVSDNNIDVSSEIRRFRLRSALFLLQAESYNNSDTLLQKRIEEALAFEKLSNHYLEVVRENDLLDSAVSGSIYSLDSLYYQVQREGEQTFVALIEKESIIHAVLRKCEEFNDPAISIQLLDEQNQPLIGNSNKTPIPISSSAIATTDKGSYTLALFLDESKTLSTELKDQQATYIWIGVLSVLFIVICGTIAAYFFIYHSNLNKLKNTFLATVTHELKTPIASCRILVDTLLDKKVTDPIKITEYYQLISQENQRLGRLVDNFLTFSRMERNKQTFQRVECSLNEIISVSLESMSVKFRNPRCHFSSQLPDKDIALYVNFDAMVTVLTNLLDNAYKYTDAEKEILLSVRQSENRLIISVSDNGIGIAKKDQKRIFQKFYQVNQKLSRQREGCGLGLSIVHYIVTAHLGTITVESKESQGTTVTLSLPI